MLLSQAHWLVAQFGPRPKPAKELAYPNARIERRERPACNNV